MKNLFALFTFTVTVFFASCTKEFLPAPIVEPAEATAPTKPMVSFIETASAEKTRIIQTVEVTLVNFAQGTTDCTADFTAAHDFSKAEVLPDQSLNFYDAAGNIKTMSFRINTYTGGDGTLQVVYDLGAHDLSGLVPTAVQYIIIEDHVAN